MAAGTPSITVFKVSDKRKTVSQQLTAVADATDWVDFQRDIAIQITGTATSVTAVVERATRGPTNTPNPAPVGDAITGNALSGIPVATFYEPGVAWWRVRITAISGGIANISITGSGE